MSCTSLPSGAFESLLEFCSQSIQLVMVLVDEQRSICWHNQGFAELLGLPCPVNQVPLDTYLRCATGKPLELPSPGLLTSTKVSFGSEGHEQRFLDGVLLTVHGTTCISARATPQEDGTALMEMSRIGNALVNANRELQRKIHELEQARAQIRVLSGLLPICAHCKKIRDQSGKWHRIESYLAKNSEAMLSHGICPECVKLHFPPDDD